MEFSKSGHAVYHTRYHLVFSTRYRRKVLKSGMGAYMQVLMQAVSRRHPEITVLEVNTDRDHIHLLVEVAPKMAISDAVLLLKAHTARPMREHFPFLDKVYWGSDGIWSTGYFVSTVGVNEDVIKKYIEHQGAEDSGQAKLDLS